MGEEKKVIKEAGIRNQEAVEQTQLGRFTCSAMQKTGQWQRKQKQKNAEKNSEKHIKVLCSGTNVETGKP